MHALITAVVVIGTGNHWILDVAVGWALVIVAMWLVDPWFEDKRQLVKRRRIEFNRRVSGAARPSDEPGRRARGAAHQRGARRVRRPPAETPLRLLAASLAGRLFGLGRLGQPGQALRTSAPSYVVHIGGRLARRKPP